MSWLTRFWERVRRVHHPEPEHFRDERLVHFSPDFHGYPMCGVPRTGALWAINADAVTCPACREPAMLHHIQHWCNTR